jgi:hypothetical protein
MILGVWLSLPQVKDVSENPLAKHAVTRDRSGQEEQLETRILENSINKICRLVDPSTPYQHASGASLPPSHPGSWTQRFTAVPL